MQTETKLITLKEYFEKDINFKLLDHLIYIGTHYEDKYGSVKLTISVGVMDESVRSGWEAYWSIYESSRGWVNYHPSVGYRVELTSGRFEGVTRLHYGIIYQFEEEGDAAETPEHFEIYKTILVDMIEDIKLKYPDIKIHKSYHPFTEEHPYTNNYLIFSL